MKHKLKRKLRSNQGATLLLSLLLFLVCVVAGSVALTAGTATSGTLSERAKLDQRYFSVTSAAELIRQKFKEQSVSVALTYDENNVVQSHNITQTTSSAEEETFILKHSLRILDYLADTDWTQTEVWNSGGAAGTDPVAYEITVKDNNGQPLPTLNANVTVKSDNLGLQFIVSSDIERTNTKGESVPDGTFSLKIPYVASVRKEIMTTTNGREVTFHVNWQIGTISYAN